TAADLVTKAGGLVPDVIVMDVGLAGLDAVTLVRELRKTTPSATVLVIGVYESRELAVQLQAAGAKGYLLKPDVGHSLAPAIRALLEHGTFFRDRLQPEADAAPADIPQQPPRAVLTAREREVEQGGRLRAQHQCKHRRNASRAPHEQARSPFHERRGPLCATDGSDRPLSSKVSVGCTGSRQHSPVLPGNGRGI